MSEWDKLKQHKFLTANNKDLYIEDFMTQMWFVGDKLQRDTKNLAYEITVHKKKILELEQKLEAIRGVVNDPPTYSIPFLGNPAPEVQDYIKRMDSWYCKLLKSAQNTDYVQKEETNNENTN